jgi:hypothetical protein
MNTHLNNRKAADKRRELAANPETYIESVGKADIATLGIIASTPKGEGTVLRLILGATAQMPLRALTYVDSTLRIAKHLPHQQIQIVHANRVGERINGISHADSHEQSVAFAGIVRTHVARRHPELESRVLHASDRHLDLRPFAGIAQEALAADSLLREKLLTKGTRHGGDAIVYSSAHFAFQDTNMLELEPFHSNAPPQVDAERIGSIGCQQERTFYVARMAMRAIAAKIDMPMIDSTQLFTRHLTPPYFVARDGEPLIGEADFNSLQLDTVGDLNARRDLAHFMQTNAVGVASDA